MSETADASAAAPVPARPVVSPESAPGDRCPNCLAPLQGPFCYDCGQSKKGLIRHFSSILGDFLDSVLNFDTRTWRTIPALYFKPGYLSNEYFAGRRVRYVTPLRLYFFLSVVAFLVISFVTPDIKPGDGQVVGISEDMTPEQQQKRLETLDKQLAFMPEAERAKIRADVEKELAARKAAQKTIADGSAELRKAEHVAAAVKDAQEAEEPLHLQFGGDGDDWDEKTNPVVIPWFTDGMNASLNAEIGEVARKAKRINKDPGPFLKQVYSTAPQALFVILPLFALLLKVFYIFKRRLYMEHLIVALHSHSFICASLLVGIGLAYVSGLVAHVPVLHSLTRLAFALTWCWLPIYLFLMQKRVYRQGWIMTTLKFFMIGVCYLFLLTFGMMATILVSLIVL